MAVWIIVAALYYLAVRHVISRVFPPFCCAPPCVFVLFVSFFLLICSYFGQERDNPEMVWEENGHCNNGVA